MILNVINGKILFRNDTTIDGVVYKAETWNVFGSLSNVDVGKQTVYITKNAFGRPDISKYIYKVGELAVNTFNVRSGTSWGNDYFGAPSDHGGVACIAVNSIVDELIFKGDSVPAEKNTVTYNVDDNEATYSPASPLKYDKGTTIKLTATPNEGYKFDDNHLPGWFTGFDNNTFTLNSDGTASFTFDDSYDGEDISISSNAFNENYSINVTLEIQGDDAGKVTTSPVSPVNVKVGKSVVVSIVPNEGWAFNADSVAQYGRDGMMGIDWVDCDKPSDISRTFTLTCEDGDSDYTMYVQVSGLVATAPVEKKTHYSFTTSSSHFSISPGMEFDVADGSPVVVTITPDSGWHIDNTDTAFVVIDGNTKTFTSDGYKYTLEFVYSNADSESYTGVLTVNLTEGDKPGDVRTNFFTVFEPTDANMKTINNAIFISPSGEVTGVVDSFISYKKFYIDIPTDGVSQLKAGQYDFGVKAPVVHKLILNYDCGELDVNEKYSSLLDYSGYTSIRIYLPFVGFVEADVNRIMGNKIKINYVVDVQSGKCLAQVLVKSVSENGKIDNEWVCIDEHSGIISRDEPINQGYIYYKGSYEVLSTVQLGELNAYLLITRKIPNEGNIGDYLGYPSSEVVTVGNCTGYVSFKQIHCDGVVCTDDERTMIENALKKGIIVS